MAIELGNSSFFTRELTVAHDFTETRDSDLLDRVLAAKKAQEEMQKGGVREGIDVVRQFLSKIVQKIPVPQVTIPTAAVAASAFVLNVSGVLPPAADAKASINMQDPMTQARVHALAKIGVTDAKDIQVYLEEGILPDSINGVQKTVFEAGSFANPASIRGWANNTVAFLMQDQELDSQTGKRWEQQVAPLRDFERLIGSLESR